MTTTAERIKGRLRLLASKRNKHRTHKHNNRTDEPPTDTLLEDDATDDDSKKRAHSFDRNDIGYEEQCGRRTSAARCRRHWPCRKAPRIAYRADAAGDAT